MFNFCISSWIRINVSAPSAVSATFIRCSGRCCLYLTTACDVRYARPNDLHTDHLNWIYLLFIFMIVVYLTAQHARRRIHCALCTGRSKRHSHRLWLTDRREAICFRLALGHSIQWWISLDINIYIKINLYLATWQCTRPIFILNFIIESFFFFLLISN